MFRRGKVDGRRGRRGRREIGQPRQLALTSPCGRHSGSKVRGSSRIENCLRGAHSELAR